MLLHRPKAGLVISVAGQVLFFVGAMALVAFLAGWRVLALLATALAGLGLGYGLLAWQARKLSQATLVKTTAWHGLKSAYLYLGGFLALGAAMACGLLRPVLPQPPLATLGFHIHLAVAGFAGLAIVGMLPKLLRLFLGAMGYATLPGKMAAGGIHAGLWLYLAGWLSDNHLLVVLATAALAVAAASFALQLVLLAGAASKPLLNSSFVAQGVAVVWLLAAAGLDVDLALLGGPWRLAEAAVYLALFGWIGGTILGTAQRIVAVLAWFQRFHEDPPAHQVPTAWERSILGWPGRPPVCIPSR